MSKKRIYDLAKEYGMSGQDLAKKLRTLGFSQVKSHMTALDDFEVLQVQGVLEAHGIVAESQPSDGSGAGGGLILRKKKKKKTKAETSGPATAQEPPPTPAPEEPIAEAAPAPTEEVQVPAAPETPPLDTSIEEPEPTPPATAEPVSAEPTAGAPPTEAPAAEESAPAAEVAQPEVTAAETADAVAESVVHEEEAPAPVEPAASVETESAPTEEEAEAPAPASEKPAAGEKAQAPEEAEGEEEEEDQPQKPKRMGKVVGFIDLSKIKTAEKKKPESRRLRSEDDVAPDVRPTMGHDRRRALMRGDRGPRGKLSASELREREAARYLRRGGKPAPAGPGGGGRGGGGGRSRQDDVGGSPHRGKTVKVDTPVTVKKLAAALAIQANQLLKVAFRELGFAAVNINSLLDEETASLLAHEFDVEIEVQQEVEAEERLVEELKSKRSSVEDEQLELRFPTVAFLGHVDHGKTTLIDKIRSSRVAEGEAGGITQHIGAYQVTTGHGHTLTILDTPGHAAFTAMRARGANAVDIVVLVVAADAGVQPHTEEAIAHARAASTPIVVALTKIDKAEANPDRAMQELAAKDLTPEDWGGDVAMMRVSGITGQGIEDLLERVFLESEMLDLKCHSTGPASGVVLEAEKQEGKGIVAHLLVQDGTLNRGDIILAGEGYGKVRSIHDDRGSTIERATPSMPVEVTGLSAIPGVGDAFYVLDDLAKAKEVAEDRERKSRATSLAEGRRFTAETIAQAVKDQQKATLNLIVRADVQGSVEVLKQQIADLEHPEIDVRLLHAGVGAVTESDALLGSTANAIIIAFNVGVNDKARQAADKAGIEIRHYQVIYELLDDLRNTMEGFLSPEYVEHVTGHVEIRRIFKSSKLGQIAGCYVLDGTVSRDSKVRLLRDSEVVYTGRIGSLRREKDDAKEVREGFECGVVLHNFQDIKEGDVIEAYKMVETKRTLDDVKA